jgi:hypothetical protein
MPWVISRTPLKVEGFVFGRPLVDLWRTTLYVPVHHPNNLSHFYMLSGLLDSFAFWDLGICPVLRNIVPRGS